MLELTKQTERERKIEAAEKTVPSGEKRGRETAIAFVHLAVQTHKQTNEQAVGQGVLDRGQSVVFGSRARSERYVTGGTYTLRHLTDVVEPPPANRCDDTLSFLFGTVAALGRVLASSLLRTGMLKTSLESVYYWISQKLASIGFVHFFQKM